MAREKLSEFLESYAPDSKTKTRISYTHSDLNGTGDIDIGDDLGKDPGSSIELLKISNQSGGGPSLINDFLSYLTEAENYYSLKGNAQSAQPLSHLDDSGQPIVLKHAENTGANNVFVKTGESSGDGLGGTLSQYSDSGYFNNKLRDIVSKRGDITPESDDGPGPHSGNRLLPSIEGSPLDTTGKTFVKTSEADSEQNSINAVQDQLLVRNRFNTKSPGKAFDPVDASTFDTESGVDGMGTRTAQSKFGQYDSTSPVMINEDLYMVARSMMLKSLGVDPAASPGSSVDPDEYDYENGIVSTLASAITTSPAKASAMRAKNAKGGPEDSTGQSPFAANGAFETDETVVSQGSDYTPGLSFRNSDSIQAIKARTGAAILGMIFTAQQIAKQIEDIDGDKIDLGRGPYQLGQSKLLALRSKLQVFQRMIIPHTRFPYSRCLNQGCKVLFGTGFSKSSIDLNDKDVQSYQTVEESTGFWYSVARSFLKKFAVASLRITNNQEVFTSETSSALVSNMAAIADSGMVGIVRTLIQIGDISLYATGGNEDLSEAIYDGVRPFNVDLLPDGPATRISKSRSQDGHTSAALAWRGSTAPSMYLLPRNVIKAAVDMNNFAMGGNPVKGHTTNDLIKKTYINVNNSETAARIPTDVVQRLENSLDAEYVPFYFHDIRTNEIISFHAFLNNLNDSYNANFSGEGGYGRIDKVQIYKDTKRGLSFSFYIAATSKEDFDEMWFKINKLTTLIYPQWTKGTAMKDTEGYGFIQPFSQVIGGTPLVRLRIGDVIKSNYSRFNLSRMFGVGEREFTTDSGFFAGVAGKSGAVIMGSGKTAISDIQIDTVFKLAFGSPMSTLGSGDAGAALGDKILRSLISSTGTLNGFVNPIGAGLVLRQLKSPDVEGIENSIPETQNSVIEKISSIASKIALGISKTNLVGDDLPGYLKGVMGDYPILKPSVDVGYLVEAVQGVAGGKTRFRTSVPYRVQIIEKSYISIDAYKAVNASYTSKGFSDPNRVKRKLQYTVQLFDLDAPASMAGKNIKVFHEDLMPNPDLIFMKNIAPYLDIIGSVAGAVQTATNELAAKTTGIPADSLVLMTTDAAEFMHPGNNVITRAFENSGGRGLAGVIRQLTFQWLDSAQTWETDWNSRAPKFCKVDIGFDVIHDLPPGLDSSGYNRAPIYNVGDTMHSIVGDVQADGGLASKQAHTRAGAAANQSLSNKLK